MIKKLLFCLSILAGFTGCKKNDSGTGYMKVRMTDAPGTYQQVNVDILQVRIHLVEANGNSSWIDLPTNAGIYDLLALQNGIDTTIANTINIPQGVITQMRLVLGNNNTVMADSIVYDLQTPSGQTSGVKLNGNMIVPANDTLFVLLDFVASESVVQHGNGEFHLKPVIRVLP